MDMNTRPPLPADLGEGSPVLLFRSSHGRGARPEPVPATVVKAARVWLTVRDDAAPANAAGNSFYELRMRRDTQRTDNGTNYNDWFVTREQYEYDERMRAVDAVISDAKVALQNGYRGPGLVWTPERRIALADLIVSLGILDAEVDA